MATNTSAERALANIIYEHYDLGEIQVPRSLDHVHQRRHRKFAIDTERGRFLVKTYKGDPQILDALRFQHRLSAYLEKNGLPVARIQPAFSGVRIIEIDDWALELQEFIEGHAMPITGRNLVTSAKALGKVHRDCKDFPCPDRESRMWRFSEVPRGLFAKFYESARGTGDHAVIDKNCNNIALFLREAGEELSAEIRDQFETGLIHGDWHGGNLMFQGEKLVAILDLEFSGDGCYLEDLAYAVSNLCVRTCSEGVQLDQRVDILMENYQKYRTLSPSEEKALYYAIGIKHVGTVCFQCIQQHGVVAGLTSSQWMGILDAQTRWLLNRAHAIKKGW